MAAQDFIEKEQTLLKGDYIPDARDSFRRMSDWLKLPKNHTKVMFFYSFLILALAPIWPFVALIAIMHHFIYAFTPKEMPFRYAADLGGLDPLDNKNAQGTYFVGWERSKYPWKKGREIWLSDDDIGMHQCVFGTTGSGKTQSLLSLQVLNSLLSSSGIMFADGKSDSELPIKIWAMCRRFGREQDFLVINYLTGGFDPFIENKRKRERLTNKANMFGDAPMDFLNELLTSMLPKAEGDSATWQQKAINMLKAVVRICCFLRSQGHIEVSVTTIRDYMALPQLIKIYRDAESNPGKFPEAALASLRAYLRTGISWNPGQAKDGEKWIWSATAVEGTYDENGDKIEFKEKIPDGVLTQHGYLTNQFLAPLSMLADTYGHIFRDPKPEANMADVMLRRRILCVAIPTLEKSPQEAANLGRLLVAAMRLMMARNLGNRIEGKYHELIKNKATNAENRFSVVLDEAGYYFAPGLDILFAQARSLFQSFTIAGQDIFAMKKEGKDEIFSVIGNAKIKICLALEEPTETFDIIQKAASEVYISRASGSQVQSSTLPTSSWASQGTTQVEKVNLIDFHEVKNMQAGEGLIIYLNRVIRFTSNYVFNDINPDTDITYKVNKFLQVDQPSFEEIEAKCRINEIKADLKTKEGRAANITDMLNRIEVPYYDQEYDSAFESLSDLNSKLKDSDLSAVLKGIVMFVGAAGSVNQMSIFSGGGVAGSGGMEHATKPLVSNTAEQEVSTQDFESEIDGLLMDLKPSGPVSVALDKSQAPLTSSAAAMVSQYVKPASWLLDDQTSGIPVKSGLDTITQNETDFLESILNDELSRESASEQLARIQLKLEESDQDPLDAVFSTTPESDSLKAVNDNLVVTEDSGESNATDSSKIEPLKPVQFSLFEASEISKLGQHAESGLDEIAQFGSIIDELPAIALDKKVLDEIERTEALLYNDAEHARKQRELVDYQVRSVTEKINTAHTAGMIDNALANSDDDFDLNAIFDNLIGKIESDNSDKDKL